MHKKPKVAVLVRVTYVKKMINNREKGYFMMINKSAHQEDVAIVYVHMTNHRTSLCLQK